MATLNGTQINNTYVGLLKTTDNLVLGATTPSVITDGVGNATPLSIAQQKVILEQDNQRLEVNDTQTSIKGDTVFASDATNFSLLQLNSTVAAIGNVTNYLTVGATEASFVGAVDFSTATVTGLPVDGVESVVAGTNVTVDNTDPANPIVNVADSVESVVAGTNVTVDNTDPTNPIVNVADSVASVVAGTNITVDNTDPANPIISAAGGGDAGLVAGTGTVGSMRSSDALSPDFPARASGFAAVAIGRNADATNESTVAIGNYSDALGSKSIAIGTEVLASAGNTIAMGWLANANQAGSVALGYGITADKVDTVSMRALDLQTPSTPSAGGIIMTDAGSVERRLNVNSGGQLQIDNKLVGVKYAASNITSVQELGPSAADVVLLNILIPAGTFIAGDIINFKALLKSDYTGGDTNYFGMGLSTTAGTLGTAFASGFSSTNQSQFFDRTLIVNTADGTGLGTTMSSTDGAVDQNNGGQYQFPDGVNGLPFNWTVDQYLYIQAFASGIGSFVESRMLMVSKIN